MSYISFYRKWRPQTFSEIIGQEYIVQTLQNAITKKRISHSYIFCGPRGTGKTSMARIFAKALNCVNGPTSKPCNKCENCLSISAGTNVDVIEIDAASNRGINEIRDLREKVKYLPINLRKKVYIIDEVHMLTTEAFNALLKVLEEPPEHVLFIMATTEPHQVIQTIMSRCQRFDFEPIPVDKIRQRVTNIASIENITINESALNLVAKYADGSLRDADGILEQLSSLGDSKITVDDITSLLGIIDQQMLFELANILLEKNLSQALLFVKRIISSNLNLKIFTSEFLEHLYNLYVIKNYENPLDLLDISDDFKESYFNQSRLFKSEELEYFIDLFSDLLRQIRWGENAKTFFKASIIKTINHEVINDEQIGKRIKRAEVELQRLRETIEQNTITQSQEITAQNISTRPVIQHESGGISDTEVADKKTVEEKSVVENIQDKPYEERQAKDKKAPAKQPQDNQIKDIPVEENQPERQTQEKKTSSNLQADKKHPENDAAEYEKLLYDKWDELQSKLKIKKVPIQAMFIETKSFKVLPNKITFYLDSNKKWHKEHLSNQANLEIIREMVSETIGKNFTIVFDLLPEKNDSEAGKTGLTEVQKDAAETTEEKGFESGPAEEKSTEKNSKDQVQEGALEDEDEGKMIKYLENKFQIKEK